MPDITGPGNPASPRLNEAWGRALAFGYGVFAVAATGRSAVQLGEDTGKLPYWLSLLAAVLYLVATTCFLLGGRRSWSVARTAVLIELVGVLVVGTWSYLDHGLFHDKTVWSHFGQGYGFLPLVLPLAGLWWLHQTRSDSRGEE